MTSRPVDSDARALDPILTDDAGTEPVGAAVPYAAVPRDTSTAPRRIDGDRSFDYRTTAIAAGALGLAALAYRGVRAFLDRRSDVEPVRRDAGPFPRDDGSHTPPAATTSAPRAAVKTAAGDEFAGEPASSQPDAAFVAASDDDDTAGLTVKAPDDSALTPEHKPADLMGDTIPGSGDRAPDAFRPDPTAPVPDAMRESLRPVTGPAKGFAGNRGDFSQGLSQADGSK